MASESGAARSERWRSPSAPKNATGLAVAALAASLVLLAASAWIFSAVRTALIELDAHNATTDGVLWALWGLIALLLFPALLGLRAALRSRTAVRAADIVQARALGADARQWSGQALGFGAAVAIFLLAVMYIIANERAVGRTFFNLDLMRDSFQLVLNAFWTNVYIFLFAEALTLIWGLLIAIARLLPGPAARPIRFLATVYTDVFRGLPAIITIYLVGFGLPLTGLPLLRDWSLEWYCILALTLTYSAYVAEVYRAGIDSIHPSQTAAARSLGLSHLQTQRFVVVPQAIRRIIPPLLNDFVSLQKDTALVNVVGAIDAFNQAKIVASNHFNLSAVTTVAILFVLITIPQARFVDRLIERDQRRTRAGGG